MHFIPKTAPRKNGAQPLRPESLSTKRRAWGSRVMGLVTGGVSTSAVLSRNLDMMVMSTTRLIQLDITKPLQEVISPPLSEFTRPPVSLPPVFSHKLPTGSGDPLQLQ